jgi:acyl-CoA synthetase (AMP-forming)/AMP-acid ligase II
MFMVYYIKGATNIILEKFDPEKVLQIIEKEKVTSVLLIPAMLIRMLNVPHIRSYDLSSLRRIWYGTAPMPAERLKEAIQIFGPIFRQNYGMSEAPQPLTYLGPEDHRVEGPEKVTRRLSSAGRPALGVDLKVVNEDFRSVNPGEVGEIAYRSRHMFQEYWNLPEETAKAFRDGWFMSGDMATVDAEGYVYIIDRKHDMIISGGFNIYPREVEEAILKHPGIAEAAVIGIPDDVWGEAVKAICTLKEGLQVTSEEVIEVCKQNLASYKKPQTVEFVAELPKNNYGKIERKKLKEKYWQGYLRRVN